MSDLLIEFKRHLTSLRERCNENRQKAGGSDSPMLTEEWEARVLQAGVDYLSQGKHLAPARHVPSEGAPRFRAPVLALEVRPFSMYRQANSLLCETVAAAVGLLAESLAGVVYAWMSTHDISDPLAPWRMECELRGIPVAEKCHARWIVRWGSGPRCYTGVTVDEAVRMCLSDCSYRAEFDQEATLAAFHKKVLQA